MSEINMYVPILRTKASEMRAIKNLTQEVKQKITPLFEIRQMNKKEAKLKSMEQHLHAECNKILKNWPKDQVFIIDTYGIPNSKALDGTNTCMGMIIGTLIAGGVNVIPTIGLDREESYIEDIKRFIHGNTEARICMRLCRQDLELPNTTIINMNILLNRINASSKNVCLMIDLRFINEDDIENIFDQISDLLAEINLNDFECFIIAGSSMPIDVSKMKRDIPNFIRRKEYEIFKRFFECKKLIEVVPKFSDYTIVNPDKPDASMVPSNKISTKIRYAIEDGWLIFRGDRHEDSEDRRNDFQGLSVNVTHTESYLGEGFSWGDMNINQCANGIERHCGWPKWVEIDINHHLTFVVHQLSNLDVSS